MRVEEDLAERQKFAQDQRLLLEAVLFGELVWKSPEIMSFDTPILLIVWRRPHALRQVINALRLVTPTRLFVACDGPNLERPSEAKKVAATRALIKQEIDWPCQVECLYSDENQGCSLGPIRAISWFFENVEEGIILEDDCVPHPDFFSYCATLLERYRQDTRVWCISGNNFQNGNWRGDGSYYFSRYNHCWGWASWRRCWQHYDVDLRNWPSFRDLGHLETVFDDPLERRYWSERWQKSFEQVTPITWWDYQWTFACLSNGGLTTLPNQNLVKNIGFGEDATHTFDPVAQGEIQGLYPLKHPSFLCRDHAADKYTFLHHFGGAELLSQQSLWSQSKRQVKSIARYLLAGKINHD